jgi:hypothetical protein
MLRGFLPLGALALAACHLVAGLDDYTQGTASSVATGGGATSTASSGGQGGSGGAGGSGPGSPILWASNLGSKTTSLTSPVVAQGEFTLLAGIVAPTVNLFGTTSSPANNVSGNYFGATLDGGITTAPSVKASFWSRDTTDISDGEPMELATASDGKQTWLGAILKVPGVGGSDSRLVVHPTSADAPILLSTGTGGISHLAMAATPDGRFLYVGYTLDQDKSVQLLQFDVAQSQALWSTPKRTFSLTAGSHQLVGMTATNKAVYFATACTGEAFGSVGTPTIPGACIVALDNETLIDGMGTLAPKQKFGCDDANSKTSPLALTAVGTRIFLALESTCAAIPIKAGSTFETGEPGPAEPNTPPPAPKSFGIFAFDENVVLMMSSFATVAEFTDPISRTPNSSVVLAPYKSSAHGAMLLVGGAFSNALKVGNQSLRTAEKAGVQAFVLGLGTDLTLTDPPLVGVTEGPGSALVQSLASGPTGELLIGGRHKGTLTLDGVELAAGENLADDVAFVVAAKEALLHTANP